MYHIRDAELDSKKGEKIYTDDDQYYYWSRFPNILYKNHDTRCERIFKATDEELEAERIYAINHPYEKARSSRSYRTQQEKDSKAEVVKIITTILLCL